MKTNFRNRNPFLSKVFNDNLMTEHRTVSDAVTFGSDWREEFVTLPIDLGDRIVSFCKVKYRYTHVEVLVDVITYANTIVFSEPVFALTNEERMFEELRNNFMNKQELEQHIHSEMF